MTVPTDPPSNPATSPPPPPTPELPPEEPKPRPHRRGRRLLTLLSLPVLLLIAGELFARFYLGLGDPPLSTADPEIEYLFKPDQDCRRFGNRIRYNHFSMRSDDFAAHKSRPDELRVLVVGDSVINGGVLIDQSRIATSLLQARLANELGRPVVVGNISAGSWGPPNQLAYLKRYGLFDADVLVIVLSSHDYADAPTFEPITTNLALPDHKPVLALWEGFQRYLLPRLGWKSANDGGPLPSSAQAKPADVRACLTALRDMIDLGRRSGARVIVAQHLARDESLASPEPGHAEIAEEVRRAGLTPVELGPAFEDARSHGGQPYVDGIHPSGLGQQLIAETLDPAIRAVLAAVPSPTAAPSVR
jgi:hypothetical protein